MKPTRKGLFGVAAVAVLGVTALLRWGGQGVAVDVAEAGRDTLSVTIPAEGITRARDRYTVAAPISGRLTRIDLRTGDKVEQGQVIARLYPAPQDPRAVATARAEIDAAEARYVDAEARLREAEIQTEQARREAERRRPLLELGAITRESLEQVELAARVAEERQESALATLRAAEAARVGARARLLGAELSDTDARPIDVHAPVAGRVERVPDESERVVLAGEPIAVLAGVGGLEVVMDILSEDAVRVRAGDDVVLTGWGGEGRLHAVVRTVTLVGYTKVSALGVEEQRVDVIADLADAPPTLGTGYRVSGEIVVWRGDDVLSVPTSALFRAGDAWRAFVVEEGRAHSRDVLIGQRNEAMAEIVEGLAEGDLVILFPPEDVDDGMAVRATATGA
ncbi:MAG TPA: efflux RND transporter periplasmic adaptor subunit [Longimicrobiales bacterium]|nr:efflux RND transporter periplasmic adaptor subunit [Longimicrobiales bacterium]